MVSRSLPFQKGLSHVHTHENCFKGTFQIWCIFYNTIARPLPTYLPFVCFGSQRRPRQPPDTRRRVPTNIFTSAACSINQHAGGTRDADTFRRCAAHDHTSTACKKSHGGIGSTAPASRHKSLCKLSQFSHREASAGPPSFPGRQTSLPTTHNRNKQRETLHKEHVAHRTERDAGSTARTGPPQAGTRGGNNGLCPSGRFMREGAN